jgi:hypothetical protein
MKIRRVRAELLHVYREADRQRDRQTDGRTDRHDEGNNRFLQFC